MALQTTYEFYACSLSFLKGRCELVSSGPADKLALLNNKDCAFLRRLKDDYNVEFDAVYSMCDFNSSGKSLELSVDINIYGTQDKAKLLADELSSAKFFLQDALWMRNDLRYENPQSLLQATFISWSCNGTHRLKLKP